MKGFVFFLIYICISSDLAAQNMQFFNNAYYVQAEKENKSNSLILAIPSGISLAVPSNVSLTVPISISSAVPINLIVGQPVNISSAVPVTTTSTGSKSTSLTEVNTFPGFTDLLGKNILLPQLEVKGLTNFNSGRTFYGEIKLFTSGMAAKNTSNISVFFPEASTYGMSMSFNWLPFKTIQTLNASGEKHEIDWFCAYFNANYLGKNLQGVLKNTPAIDTAKFTSDFGHLKFGFQIIPKLNILSFYGDINFICPVVNRDLLLVYNPLMKRGFSNFFHFGTKFFIATGGEEKPINLMLDLSAIVVDNVTKTIYQTNDALIPRLSIGATVKFR